MEWLLVLVPVLVVVGAVGYLGSRRRRWEQAMTPQFPSNDPPGRGTRSENQSPDARGAVNKNSWMLGGSGF
ncbi:hypothetical protein [Modestobacter roseus]|uniref:Uncharacterized protein n=1 Tax=Modestobacter roseus TaxID=1181884 RepID=A0A562ISS4_9ACTN|nr:hypothetical protein [Modestobacter roseus]MQA32574.1 hypothetical protein [Modestobacter roseus]TWH73783.1 hypothetical protein JD78_02307 [Modestobacter roseus]